MGDLKLELLHAIQRNNHESVEGILQDHPDLVNCKFNLSKDKVFPSISTPLIEACLTGELETVQILLRHGAEVSSTGHRIGLPLSFIRHLHHDVCFPLMVSVAKSNLHVVRELLDAGAAVNDLGQAVLHVCCMQVGGAAGIGNFTQEQATVLRTLIESGADVNLQDCEGKTPLHYACECGNSWFVSIMLENGAQVTLRDNHGFDVLETSAHYSYDVMSTLFERCEFSTEERINAYETVALSETCPSLYESLQKATLLRIEHDIPKNISLPLECYGFTKEFETLAELELFQNNPPELILQSILARERIYKGRYIDLFQLMDESVIDNADGAQLNALLKHHLRLFHENNDCGNFSGDFKMYGNRLEDHFKLLQTDIVAEYIKTAMQCCQYMKDIMEKEKRLAKLNEAEVVFWSASYVVVNFIFMLQERNWCLDDHQTEKTIAQGLFEEVCARFLEVNPKNGRFTLQSVLWHLHLEYYPELIKWLLDLGYDVDSTDENGNTLLHLIIEKMLRSLPPYNVLAIRNDLEKTVNLLLDRGLHVLAKNKDRQS